MSRKTAVVLTICVAVMAMHLVKKFEDVGTSLKNTRQATVHLIEAQ